MRGAIFRKGQKVKAVVAPKASILSGWQVRPGTEGEIIGVRHGTTERLVKFKGHGFPVHCEIKELKEI